MHSITQQYWTDSMTMNFCWLKAQLYANNVPVNYKSLWQHQYFMAYFSENCDFIYPMQKLVDAAGTLQTLEKDVGIPNSLFTDNASLLTEPGSTG